MIMKWSELSMKDKAAIMKVAINNGVTDLNDIKNKFDDGGYFDYMDKLAKKKAKDNKYIPSESQLKNKDFDHNYTNRYLSQEGIEYVSDKYKKYDEGGNILGIDVPIEAEIGASFVPILGTLMDAEQFYKNPSWTNAGALGISLLAEIPFLKWLKAGKAAKVAKNASKFEEAKRNYERAAKVVDRMENTPNINPAKLDRARGARGKAFFDMKVANPNSGVKAHNDLQRLRNQEFVNSLINGALISTDIGFNTYQQFGEE